MARQKSTMVCGSTEDGVEERSGWHGQRRVDGRGEGEKIERVEEWSGRP